MAIPSEGPFRKGYDRRVYQWWVRDENDVLVGTFSTEGDADAFIRYRDGQVQARRAYQAGSHYEPARTTKQGRPVPKMMDMHDFISAHRPKEKS